MFIAHTGTCTAQSNKKLIPLFADLVCIELLCLLAFFLQRRSCLMFSRSPIEIAHQINVCSQVAPNKINIFSAFFSCSALFIPSIPFLSTLLAALCNLLFIPCLAGAIIVSCLRLVHKHSGQRCMCSLLIMLSLSLIEFERRKTIDTNTGTTISNEIAARLSNARQFMFMFTVRFFLFASKVVIPLVFHRLRQPCSFSRDCFPLSFLSFFSSWNI